MQTNNSKNVARREPKVRWSAWLADQHPNWIKLVKESGMKLRAACKLVVNTDTMKVRSLPTIEACRPPSKKYLPLSMPDGSWHFETDKQRDEVMALLVS
jgi:hypothetical protein